MRRSGIRFDFARRAILPGLFLASCAGVLQGQNNAAIKAAEAACGPSTARFHVDVAPVTPKLSAGADDAIIYVIEMPSGPTLRVGIDGKWVGADKGASYLGFHVSPGAHHLCVQQQSRFKVVASFVALNSVEARPGHVYYFMTDIARPLGPALFRLDAVNTDEGRELCARWPAAVAQALPPAKK